ncbi:integral membrane sensor signal transduction histidine kinase [Ktedonobacter racemifer DSM 44963]|uniref:Oxygen sensor histidine kinase NreB n=2 Tax=Ktedonobacter racemifer TaxID=363277 RepID=D6TIF7_KTERA|nr:integral membrane sensor signal transduction histidine kinase [Ktedonobacter racemifer DSM 44963]
MHRMQLPDFVPSGAAREKNAASQRPIWLRWLPFWHGFASLFLVTVIGLAFFHTSNGQTRALLILLAFLWLGWYSVCVVSNPLSWHGHPWRTCGYLIIGWALWVGLISLDFSCFVLLLVLYTQVFLFPPMPWKVLLALALTGLYLWCEVVSTGSWDSLIFFELSITVLCIIIAVFVDAVVRQSHIRQRLFSELEATRQELAQIERQAGITEERQRLAHEIHDTLAQGFIGIVMHLETADAVLQGETETARQHLDQARFIARENLVEARRLMWALQPEALDRAPLSEVLGSFVACWSQESGISATTLVTGQARGQRPERELALLRAAQEALTNVRKHAHASRVTVTLSYMEDMVTLDVQDNGIGFEQNERYKSFPQEHASGFGLKGLRERVKKLQGTLAIESMPGEGTTLAVALPEESCAHERER